MQQHSVVHGVHDGSIADGKPRYDLANRNTGTFANRARSSKDHAARLQISASAYPVKATEKGILMLCLCSCLSFWGTAPPSGRRV